MPTKCEIPVFNTSLISTSEPENVQAVHATNFQDYDLGPIRKGAFRDILGDGIFTTDGEQWSHYRQQLRPQFNREQISDGDSLDRHVQLLFKSLPSENANGWIGAIDMLPFVYRFTMDVSTDFLFGHSVDSQSRNLHSQDSGNTTSKELQEDVEFTEAETYAQDFLSWRVRFGSFYHFLTTKKYRKACETVQKFADRFVKLALDPEHKRPSGKEKKYVLLDELTAETRDPLELRNQVLHVMLAARDTTAGLIGFVLLLLARHPDEFAKLRATVLETFGTESAPIGDLSFSSIKACRALNNCLYESLRLYPSVAMNSRRALRNTTLPVGGGPDGRQPIAVRKGEQVIFVPYMMHRRQDIWGDDAEQFRPNRWVGRKLGWEMLPFGGGPRACLGQQFALNEVSFVLVRFLQRFDAVEAEDRKKGIVKNLSITLSPALGQRIKLHRAAE